ncbi:hypothetical protein TYRP_008657 [Tyrophagus putrescentiae]|nr:hypothetical protein TYRP_008657 [Tyrophagus putrescentiae]
MKCRFHSCSMLSFPVHDCDGVNDHYYHYYRLAHDHHYHHQHHHHHHQQRRSPWEGMEEEEKVLKNAYDAFKLEQVNAATEILVNG